MPQKFISSYNLNDNFLAVGKLKPMSLVSRGCCDRRCHANVGRYDREESLDGRSIAITRHFVLFLTCSTILKPDLRHSLTQSSHVCDSLEILTVGVAIDCEVCLKNLKLILCKCCSNAFRFVFVESIAIVAV